MARSARSERNPQELELVQPVYLNVPMMVSFLAALEGGMHYREQVTEKNLATQAKEGEGSAKVGLPSLASLIGLTVDINGRIKHTGSGEEQTETTVVREHTEASLFNLLRHRLNETGRADYIATVEDIATAYPGQIVEIEGEVVGNPLRQFLDAVFAMGPYVGLDFTSTASTGSQAPKGQRKGSPSAANPVTTQAHQAVDMFTTMRNDADKATVVDLVLEGGSDVRAVLTMAREFLPQSAEDNLLQGHFAALGKVTRVLSGDDEINLLRRTALGLAAGSQVRDLFSAFSSAGSGFKLGEPVVGAPLLQILPLAVFI